MADLWQTAGIAITCFLAVVARRLVRVCFREIRIWYSWSKLPHSPSPWSLAGELVPATSLKRHDFYTARTKQLGGIFGIRVGPLFVRPLRALRSLWLPTACQTEVLLLPCRKSASQILNLQLRFSRKTRLTCTPRSRLDILPATTFFCPSCHAISLTRFPLKCRQSSERMSPLSSPSPRLNTIELYARAWPQHSTVAT